MVTVVFAKSYNKKDCGNLISASVVFAFGFYSSNSNCSISVLVEIMVTMVKITLALKCLSSSVRILDVLQSLRLLPLRVYNTARVKLQLTASLLLHTRSFLAIVRSCNFFFFRSFHPLTVPEHHSDFHSECLSSSDCVSDRSD